MERRQRRPNRQTSGHTRRQPGDKQHHPAVGHTEGRGPKRRRPKTLHSPKIREEHPVAAEPDFKPGRGERLQKVLAAAGLGSRRQCEELITTGRVEVDRVVVTELGTRVDPAKQAIRVDGVALPQPRLAYYAVHKPAGVVTTNSDPARRPRVIDLLPNQDERLFPIGRLDLHSEGLILVTNDGDLANRLTHPRYGVTKVYKVLVAGHPTPETLAGLLKGVHLAEGLARVKSVAIKARQSKCTVLEMVLDEGRNREIRRVLARVGHKVLRLQRIAVGPVRLGLLPPGEHRPLTSQEVKSLREACGQPTKGSREGRKKTAGHSAPRRTEERKKGTRNG
jgi:23S rRNA pseudouridine2605 synthase